MIQKRYLAERKDIIMKKMISVAAVVALMSPAAFASKAYKSVLGAVQTGPTTYQDIFYNPSKVNDFSNVATFEFGSSTVNTSDAANKSAEAGVIRTFGDHKVGFYLGHKSANYVTTKGKVSTPTTASQFTTDGNHNPFEITYGTKFGDIGFGVGLTYSAYENKVETASTLAKESNMGLRVGAAHADWEAALNLGLGTTADFYNATAGGDKTKYKGATDIGLRGLYNVSPTLGVYASYNMFGGKYEVTGSSTEYSEGNYKLGVESKVAGDGHVFIYGAYFTGINVKTKVTGANDAKDETTALPVYLGFQTEATSWLTLRAAASQSILVSGHKVTPATGTATTETTGANDTTVAAGFGIKFNKVTMDASLTGASDTGKVIDFTKNVGAQGSLTYNF